MIVEDDANIRYLLETAATRTGVFEPVVGFANGHDAWEALRASEPASLPALIVSDLSMPRMSGMELLRAAKSEPALRAIPFAIITSSHVPRDRDAALAEGACAFIVKPYGLDALGKALLELRNACRETDPPDSGSTASAGSGTSIECV